MTPVQPNIVKVLEDCRHSCKHSILRFSPTVLSFWFVVFLNMQSFGEGHEFCFDASNEGYRLDTTKTIKSVHADYSPECIYQCLLQDKSCRSANFRKTSSTGDNCELLRTVDSEEPPESLIKNENYDHYKLLQPERKSEVVLTSSPPQTTQELSTILGSCQNESWATSFNSAGLSKCPSTFPYINGLYRSNRVSESNDPISNLDGARCCKSEGFENIHSDCVDENWIGSFDKENWNLCTAGYYLSGLYRSDDHYLHNIEKAYCCKPTGALDSTTACYDEDVWSSFDNEGMVSCTEDGYYITGLYRSNCNLLYCIEQLRCCKFPTIL